MLVKPFGKLVCAILGAIVVVAVFTYSSKAATNPNVKPLVAYFQGDPACVNPGDHDAFPLVVRNDGQTTLNIIVRLAYVVALSDNDPHGVVVTDGTSHLLGGPGNLYWSIALLPGQSITRTLVAVIPEPWTQKGPLLYGLTEFVYVSGSKMQFPVSSTPVFCDSPLNM